jgi:hypothetical protein
MGLVELCHDVLLQFPLTVSIIAFSSPFTDLVDQELRENI